MSSQKFIPNCGWDVPKRTHKKKSFWRDSRGDVDIAQMVISLSVALVIVAYVAPIGVEAIYGVNFTAWAFTGESEDTKATGLMKLLPLFGVLAIVIAVIAIAKRVMS